MLSIAAKIWTHMVPAVSASESATPSPQVYKLGSPRNAGLGKVDMQRPTRKSPICQLKLPFHAHGHDHVGKTMALEFIVQRRRTYNLVAYSILPTVLVNHILKPSPSATGKYTSVSGYTCFQREKK